MNAGQQQFFDFIIAKVKEGMEEKAKELLNSNFKKQDEGTFGLGDALSFLPSIIGMIKPEYEQEVTAVLKQFSSNMGK